MYNGSIQQLTHIRLQSYDKGGGPAWPDRSLNVTACGLLSHDPADGFESVQKRKKKTNGAIIYQNYVACLLNSKGGASWPFLT